MKYKIICFYLAIVCMGFIHQGCTPVHHLTHYTVGSQVWMSKNADVDKFRNGDIITYAKNYEMWQKAQGTKQPAYCYFNFDENNGIVYGKLYNWYAVNDPRGLAPSGYHVPSNEEWQVLIDSLGGNKIAGESLGSNFDGSNKNKNSGFMPLFGGRCGYYSGFYDLGLIGYWWSSTESDEGSAWLRYLKQSDNEIYMVNNYKSGGYSVRFLKD